MPKPSLFRFKYCDMLEEHMAKGLSYVTFGAVIGVTPRTLYNWENEFPAWADAKERALNRCRLFWEQMGIAGAAGKIRGFQVGAWIYNVRCRFRDEWEPMLPIDRSDNPTVTLNLSYDPLKPLIDNDRKDSSHVIDTTATPCPEKGST